MWSRVEACLQPVKACKREETLVIGRAGKWKWPKTTSPDTPGNAYTVV